MPRDLKALAMTARFIFCFKVQKLFSTVVYTLNLPLLSSVPDQRSLHAGHRSGTAPHAQFWSSARMYPPLTRHSLSLSLPFTLTPTIFVVNCTKSCGLRFINTLKVTGFAGGGRLDLVIPGSGNIFSQSGVTVIVFILSKGVSWGKLWSTPPTAAIRAARHCFLLHGSGPAPTRHECQKTSQVNFVFLTQPPYLPVLHANFYRYQTRL